MAEYRRAIELDPNYAFAHNNLGIALKDQGDNEERDEPTLSRLVSSAEPAPIDIIAFGKRLAEIIANQPASEPRSTN